MLKELPPNPLDRSYKALPIAYWVRSIVIKWALSSPSTDKLISRRQFRIYAWYQTGKKGFHDNLKQSNMWEVEVPLGCCHIYVKFQLNCIHLWFFSDMQHGIKVSPEQFSPPLCRQGAP
jgi:hypothetical protein